MDCLVALAALVAPMSAIAAGCSIDGSQVSFGQLDPLGRNEQTAIGTITLRCDGVEGSVVRVGLGSGNSMRFEQREMSDGVHRIRYNLYLDPAQVHVFAADGKLLQAPERGGAR